MSRKIQVRKTRCWIVNWSVEKGQVLTDKYEVVHWFPGIHEG